MAADRATASFPSGRRCAAAGLAAAVVLSILSLVPTAAFAGGTAVIAPKQLATEDCTQGARPREIGSRAAEVGPFVIGCATLPSGERALVAAERGQLGRGFTCFYVVPAGTSSANPACYRPEAGARYGGDTPLAGASGIAVQETREPPGWSAPYVAGQLSGDAAQLELRYRSAAGSGRSAIERISVEPTLASQLGAPLPFFYFVGELPPSAELCGADLRLGALDAEGDTIDRVRVSAPASAGCLEPGLARRLGASLRQVVRAALQIRSGMAA